MNSLLNFLLRVLSVGRSDDDRVSLLGDLEEEHRARRARGAGELAAFAWYASEIVRCLAWDCVTHASRLRTPDVAHATVIAPRSPVDALVARHQLSLRLLIRNPG